MNQIVPFASAATIVPGGLVADAAPPAIRTDAVQVVFTSIDETLAAVRVAADFAKALRVPVVLTHIRTVPYALPVEAPTGVSPVHTKAFTERLRAEGVDIRVRVCLCRDARQAIAQVFAPDSLIVVAGRRRAWPTAAARWRRALEAAGHYVVSVDTSGSQERTHA